MNAIALMYLALISAAEALTIVNHWAGLILHSLILLALLFHGATTRQTGQRRFLIVLTLAPLIRILSISLPLRNLPLIFWYLAIGGLLFVAALVALRVTGLGARRIGLAVHSWPAEIGIASIGLVLGLMEYFILYPAPLIAQLRFGEFLLAAFILLVFTGILEEFIFRGLIQETSLGVLGRGGLIYTAFLFAILHIGYLSLADVLFVFGVGLLFGLFVARTRSLVGVSLAHGLTNISLYLIYPFLFAGLASSTSPSTPQDVLSPPREIPHFRGRYSTPTPTPAGGFAPAPAPIVAWYNAQDSQPHANRSAAIREQLSQQYECLPGKIDCFPKRKSAVSSPPCAAVPYTLQQGTSTLAKSFSPLLQATISATPRSHETQKPPGRQPRGVLARCSTPG